MAEKQLEGCRVAIIATDLFEEAELIEPRKALDQAGARNTVIAPHSGEIQAVQHDKKTQKVKVDMTLDEAKPGDFDAVLLPGGALNADALRMEKKAQEFVQQFDREGKPIAVICHGPWLLISAGLVKGRHMTSYHTIQDDLKNAGANCCSCTWKVVPFTTTATGPTVSSSGASTLICVGLMYSTYAGIPSIVTETPSNEVGSAPLTKSLVCHRRVVWARFVPKMATHVAGAKLG